MATLDKILSQVVLRTDSIRDRVTAKTDEVLGTRAAGKGAAVRLALTGVFKSPWGSTQAEIDAINDGSWFPASEDFVAVMKNSRYKGKGGVIEIGSTEEFIGLLLAQKPNSITEIRLITHGGVGSIGFEGAVVKGNVLFGDELDLGVIAGLQRDGIIVGDGDDDVATHQWSDVRARFRDDAVFVIYGCKVGMSESFIQEVANEFGVRVKAFKHEIHFAFPAGALSPGGIDRRKLSIDGKTDLLDVSAEIDKSPIKGPPAPRAPAPSG